MIGFLSRFVLILALGAFALEAAPRTEHIFIISIDGGSPAVMRRSPMPVLETLVREGAVSWTAQTIRPSITLPAHTSMLTGVRMEKHGITWNDWVPTNPVVCVPTIFAAAKAAGYSTAMFVAKVARTSDTKAMARTKGFLKFAINSTGSQMDLP